MQQPKLLSKVWAALGLKNDIPDSRRTGIPNESATYEEGFPQITMTPIALGGKAPSGKDMNGILNELSAHTVYQNQGGIYKFDSAFAEKIGGYSKGSLLINNKLDKLFISLVDKNKTDFNSQDFSGKWEVVSGVNFFVPKTQKATLQETGIVKLYSGYDSDAEDLAATPKAIKTLKAFIDAITRNITNYIPNSKKSSAIDSNSADDVATSAAVKSANDNANGRVSKSGDTMTGGLSIKQGDYSGISLYNNDGYYLRLEGNNHANGTMLTAVYRKPNGENVAVAFLPKRDGTIAYIDQVVNKTGDTMTGNLTVPNLIVNDPTNNNNFVQIGDDTKLIDVDMGHTVGLQTTDNANDAYIAYGATKKRFGFDGANFKADSGIAAQWYQADAKGHGAFVSQWQDKTAPYVVNNPNANGSNIYFPFIKGFNSNGSLYGTAFSFGYMTPDHIDQFGSGVIHLIEDNGSEKHWWFDRDGKLRGDEFECQGKRLSKSHQTDYAYVETTASIWGGLKINRNGEHMLIESNERGGFNFLRRNNSDGSNVYVLSTPTKNGTLATLEDLPKERLIWQGSTDNPITLDAQVSKGVLFVLMDTPHGAQANRPIWFSSPIEHCHDTKIGDFNTGGTAGDYNFNTLALLSRNGTNITITPLNDGRKPRIQKVVVFG
jgi:probable tail fiber protein